MNREKKTEELAQLYAWANQQATRFRAQSARLGEEAQRIDRIQKLYQERREEGSRAEKFLRERMTQSEPPRANLPPAPPPAAEEPPEPARRFWPHAERIREKATLPEAPDDRPEWLRGWPPPAEQLPPLELEPRQPPPAESLETWQQRAAARWYAARRVMGLDLPEKPVAQAARRPSPALLAVLPTAGGTGKTTLTATLGRALCAQGERVLLVESEEQALLASYFGAASRAPGEGVRVFLPPGTGLAVPIHLLTLTAEEADGDRLMATVGDHGRAIDRVIVDASNLNEAAVRALVGMAGLLLSPMTPELHAMAGMERLEARLRKLGPAHSEPWYVLNRFDSSLPMHTGALELLRLRLGERLLPTVLRHAPEVGEALGDGMTILDSVPDCHAADEYRSLAGWVREMDAPARSAERGARWVESRGE